MKKRSWLKGLYLLLIVAQQAWGQIPQAVSFQGVLKDNSGNILSDGPYSLTYSLYGNLTGGSVLWSATQVDTVKSGVLSAVIGRSSPISLAFDGQYYLGIAIGAASELTPRIQLTSSAYSLNARSVRGGTNVFPADGNVGIGTTSPSRKLHIQGGVSDWPLYVTGTSNLFLADGNGGAAATAKLAQVSNGAGTEVVVLGNGNVGIGTLNPSRKLHIAGGAADWPLYVTGTSNLFLADGGGGALSTAKLAQISNGAGTEVVVLGNGNVGIGTTSPNTKLHIAGSSTLIANMESSDINGSVVRLNATATGGRPYRLYSTANFHSQGAGKFFVYDETSDAYRFAIDGSGNVGIGTTSPSTRLHVVSASTLTANFESPDGNGSVLRLNATAGGGRPYRLYSTANSHSQGAGKFFIYDETSDAYRFAIDGSGNVGIGVTNPGNILQVAQGRGPAIADNWQTYSSRRWKTNIKPLENTLGIVKRLRGVSYDWKKTGRHDIGLIAEEVGEVIPEVVSYEDNSKEARGVDYARLVAVLIEAAKEQQVQLEQQQGVISELNRRLVTLEEVMQSYSSETPKAENLIAKDE